MKNARVLFVCLGNICRSPLGAAILKKKLRDRNLAARVQVDSCGTSNYHIGDNADPRTIANASSQGVDIEHCARQITVSDLREFDYIFAMDRNNCKNILALEGADAARDKIKLMREFDPHPEAGEVPDPYHGGDREFQKVFDILDRSLEHFVNVLEKELSGGEKK